MFYVVSEGFLLGCYDMKEFHEGLRELISDDCLDAWISM